MRRQSILLGGAGWVRQRLLPAVLFGLRMRLTLWYLATLALVLVLCCGAIYLTEQQLLLSQLDSRLSTRLRQLAGQYDARSGHLIASPDAATEQGEEIVLLLSPAGRVVQTQAAGQLSAVKVPWAAVLPALRALAKSGDPVARDQGFMLTRPVGATKAGVAPAMDARPSIFRLAGMPLTVQQRVTALLIVGIRSDVPQQLADLLHTLETVVPLVVVLCAGAGYWLADRAVRPIRTITRTAQVIGATDLSKRLNLRRRDEVGQLGATFDQMLERLQAAFERQRQFTADASHELRTPLAILDLEATRALARPRTAAEYRQAIGIMQQETHRMTSLVEDLLTLARADSGEAGLQRAEVDLGEVVLDVVERLVPLAQHSGMALTIGDLPELLVWGDQVALTRMLTNIVENALKYGLGRGTQVRVSGGCRRHNDIACVWLQVADDGPGVADEHLLHLCERFYRADLARTHCPREKGGIDHRPTGSGLGLAISQWIVSDHGGTLRLQSAPDHGLVVDIWLPAGSPFEGCDRQLTAEEIRPEPAGARREPATSSGQVDGRAKDVDTGTIPE